MRRRLGAARRVLTLRSVHGRPLRDQDGDVVGEVLANDVVCAN